MRKWDVFFLATKITKGLELDFFENPPVDPEPVLEPYDRLVFDVVARRSKFEGTVVTVLNEGEAIIEAQGVKWRITRPLETETVHPIQTLMKPRVWIVREEVQ